MHYEVPLASVDALSVDILHGELLGYPGDVDHEDGHAEHKEGQSRGTGHEAFLV